MSDIVQHDDPEFVRFRISPLRDWFLNQLKPMSDEQMWELAIKNVDSRLGYSKEMSPDPEEHQALWDEEYQRIQESRTCLTPAAEMAYQDFYLGDNVEDNEGDTSVISEFLPNGRIKTDRGWTYWPHQLTRI